MAFSNFILFLITYHLVPTETSFLFLDICSKNRYLEKVPSENITCNHSGYFITKEAPPWEKTLQEILDLCQEKDIQIVDFKMTDIDGRWRHLSIPVGRLNEETMQYGIGFDGSNYGYAPVESSDMVFVPDLDSATVDPFAEVPHPSP